MVSADSKASAGPDVTLGSPDSVPDAPTATGKAVGPETELWNGRTSWKHFAGRTILWVLGNVAALILVLWIAGQSESFGPRGAAWIITGVLILSGILVLGKVFLTIYGRRYRLTSQRLFIVRGILSQTTDQTELIRVDDVRQYKSFFDRLFGVGTVSILTTDATDRETLIEGIESSETVAESIRDRVRALRNKSLFVENL